VAGKRVAILQSSYVPWKGVFDIMALVDEFVLLDDVQYTRRDWRNRNRIKTPEGLAWLTIPVQVKGRYHQRIDETLISDSRWAADHLKILRANYTRAPHGPELLPEVAGWYGEAAKFERLTDVNAHFLRAIADKLGITTPMTWSADYDSSGRASDRILSLCRAAGAAEYVSGPAAQAYLDVDAFTAEGMEVRWMDYSGYPSYPQLYGDFDHHVSILDLLVHTGSEAPRYLKHLEPVAGP
jgi:hypothetical protein